MFESLMTTRALELGDRHPTTVTADTTLGDALERMRRHHGAVVVTDASGRLSGIFTERDLIFRIDHTDAAWRRAPIGDVMTRDPETLPAEATVLDAIRLLSERRYRRIPIVDAGARCLGLLGIRDVLRLVVELDPQEFINVPPDPKSEAPGRWGG